MELSIFNVYRLKYLYICAIKEGASKKFQAQKRRILDYGQGWKAVLTGDIISSSKLTPARRKALYDAFSDVSTQLKINYPLDVSYNISNFRGDGWQVVCNRPEKSLEIGIFIRTYLRFVFKSDKLDTRFAIGIGSINFIPKENVSAGDGEAYTRSGHTLDALETEHMALGFSSESDQLFSMAVEGLVGLLDFIITSWSASQSQAVFLALHGYKQEEIAQHWAPAPITQASVSVILKTAGWVQVKKSLPIFEKLVSSITSPE